MSIVTSPRPVPESPAGAPSVDIRTIRHSFRSAMLASLRKFDPRTQWSNPVLFIVWCGAAVTTVFGIVELFTGGQAPSGGINLPPGFTWVIIVWLWLTVLTANMAEVLAEGRGRPHAAALRSLREPTQARRIRDYDDTLDPAAIKARFETVMSTDLEPGDVIILTAGDTVPADGDVLRGKAMVDESAVTGESAAVVREPGDDRAIVTAGTRILSDRIVVRITSQPGTAMVDRMIALAEGAHRHKSPTERALTALIVSFAIAVIVVAVTLNVIVAPVAPPVSLPVLASLVVTLVPAEIAALLAVTGIASRYQLLRRHVLVVSTHALETAGDITTVVLDKTGTITQGNRRATRFIPLEGVDDDELIYACVLSSLDDPTPEGRSIIRLAQMAGFSTRAPAGDSRSVPFTAETRMSGRDTPDLRVRKGAESPVLAWLKHVGTQQSHHSVDDIKAYTNAVAANGGTPLLVAAKPADGPGRVLGVIELRDIMKPNIPARCKQLKTLGVRTVMVTGDNPLTAKAIAAKAGIDDFLADVTPAGKLALIKEEQAAGRFVAMTGDGTNDAPALAQADVGVAMNSATAAARETANMIALDDDPTKLVDIIEIGRRQMTTRGALVTFNMANDVIRYLALFPALFVGTFPGLGALNVLHLHSPASAVLSTVVYSVVVIGLLIPLAIVGVPYKISNLGRSLTKNLLYYGVGGIIVGAVMIKALDLLIALFPGY